MVSRRLELPSYGRELWSDLCRIRNGSCLYDFSAP